MAVQGEVLSWRGDEVTLARRGSGDAVHGEVTATDMVARRWLDGGVVTAQARCSEAKRARRRGCDGAPASSRRHLVASPQQHLALHRHPLFAATNGESPQSLARHEYRDPPRRHALPYRGDAKAELFRSWTLTSRARTSS